ncbi:MAG: DUF1013 domain-containing protein [Micavibrio sp.]
MSKPQDAPKLLMPMATAVWFIENTALDFEQIADFTGLHKIQIEAIADEEVGRGIVGRDPVKNNELAPEELEKAKADSSYRMNILRPRNDLPSVKIRAKGPKYTPVSKRSDKPDAIAWILKNHPEISDAQITRLVGTTKPTIQAVRDRTHPNSTSMKPRHPAELGLCSYQELEKASEKGLRAQGKDPAAVKAERLAAEAERNAPLPQDEDNSREGIFAGFDFSNFMSNMNKENKGE